MIDLKKKHKKTVGVFCLAYFFFNEAVPFIPWLVLQTQFFP